MPPFFKTILTFGAVLYFLAKLSSLILLSQSWNQPFLPGASFLLLEHGIQEQSPGTSCAKCFWALPAGHMFFDSFLLEGEMN